MTVRTSPAPNGTWAASSKSPPGASSLHHADALVLRRRGRRVSRHECGSGNEAATANPAITVLGNVTFLLKNFFVVLLGPILSKRLHETLHVETLEQLEAALHEKDGHAVAGSVRDDWQSCVPRWRKC